MNPIRSSVRNSSGSALIVVLSTVVILSLAGAAMLRMASSRYRNTMQTAGWNEAIYSAEAGADIAIAAIQKDDWTGWQSKSGGSVSSAPPSSTASPPASTDVNVFTTTLSHTSGMGGNQSAILVEIDAPAALKDSSGQWYRVRSTGVAQLPGPRLLGFEPALALEDGTRQNARDKLRQFALQTDRSGGLLVGQGQAARTVEVILQPPNRGAWDRAITAKTIFKGGAKFTIDSFDSSNSSKSTDGLYDAAKRQSHADVAVNADGKDVDFGGGYLYGSVAVNGGTPKATQNVQGTITNTFTQQFIDVPLPTWSVINPTPSSIVSTSATLIGGPPSSPQRYKLSAISVDSGNTIHLKSQTPGQPSTVEIWCTKDVDVKGTSQIIIDSEVTVKIYIEGKFSQSGGSFTNLSGKAAQLSLIGINPSDSTTPQWAYNSTSDFIGTIYGTAVQFKVTGSANFHGAVLCQTVDFGGSVDAGFHFDEALLGGSGSSSAYQVASWVESVR